MNPYKIIQDFLKIELDSAEKELAILNKEQSKYERRIWLTNKIERLKCAMLDILEVTSL